MLSEKINSGLIQWENHNLILNRPYLSAFFERIIALAIIALIYGAMAENLKLAEVFYLYHQDCHLKLTTLIFLSCIEYSRKLPL